MFRLVCLSFAGNTVLASGKGGILNSSNSLSSHSLYQIYKVGYPKPDIRKQNVLHVEVWEYNANVLAFIILECKPANW